MGQNHYTSCRTDGEKVGLEKGRIEGEKIGHEKGKAEGEKIGVEKEKIMLAKKMVSIQRQLVTGVKRQL